jgi:hypothetical protein
MHTAGARRTKTQPLLVLRVPRALFTCDIHVLQQHHLWARQTPGNSDTRASVRSRAGRRPWRRPAAHAHPGAHARCARLLVPHDEVACQQPHHQPKRYCGHHGAGGGAAQPLRRRPGAHRLVCVLLLRGACRPPVGWRSYAALAVHQHTRCARRSCFAPQAIVRLHPGDHWGLGRRGQRSHPWRRPAPRVTPCHMV